MSYRWNFTVVFLALWIGLLFLQKTNFVAADLGRHLMNGKIISESGKVFQKNLYSYTNPDYSAPNHHWLFGVLVYDLHRLGGFPLITVSIALVYWGGIMLSFFMSTREAKSWMSILAAFLLLPIFALRTETRPEAFSVLGLSLTIAVCFTVWQRTPKWMVGAAVGIIFLIQLVWVNVHILFVLGFLVSGSYFLFAFINRSSKKLLIYTAMFFAQLLASMINPLSWKTLVYPLQILQDYQYPVAENQSVFFFLRYHPSVSYFYLVAILIFASAALIVSFKKASSQMKPLYVITAILIVATAGMNRFSAFLQIPLLIVLTATMSQLEKQKYLKQFFTKNWYEEPLKASTAAIVTTGLVLCITGTGRVNPFTAQFGTGVLLQAEAAGDFFTTHQLPGPIFNNYDVGGYLIYKLFPKQQVFVDNRPEAYPGNFLTEKYIAAQESESNWQSLENEYQFNTIFFYRHDATDWGQPFLIRRLKDETWSPIYVDDYTVIFLKNTVQNQALISALGLPKTMFSVGPN